jgi:DUF4097 and DUF4098 domain-containing protein YvlB
MLNIKKISLIALLLLLIGVIGCLLTFQSAFQAEPIHEERTFNQDIKHIKINSDNATVNVMRTSDPEIVAELTGTNSKGRKSHFNTEVKGDTLVIDFDEAQVKYFNFLFHEYHLQLNVYLPEKIYDSITVDLVNGNVDIEELQVTDLKAKTVNGKINIEYVETSNVQVLSENGAIYLKHTTGQILGNVTNGKITIEAEHLEQNMNLESINGAIDVRTMTDPTNVDIDVENENGIVRLFGEKDYHFTVGNGEHHIHLKSVNGNISVRK